MIYQEYPFIIGTAGHIDHGKTTLVRRLTGINCDRLHEEKKRGISIELGFAPLKLNNNRIISIIDVPGHEKFIRQMVAGATGIDAALLIIAADEGVMPQTSEHLDILNLLGIKDGFVVVTKTDLVDQEFLEIVIEDIERHTRGTFLEGKEIISVSSTNGEGIENLLTGLHKLIERAQPRNKQGAFFLPIDRAFHMPGFGCVVTGTGYRGVLTEEAKVDLLPSGISSSVRSIQTHGSNSHSATAGQRMAINVPSVPIHSIRRGEVLCASGEYRITHCLDAQIHILQTAPAPLIHWQRIHLHIGTTEVSARVVILENSTIQQGQTGYIQLIMDEPLVTSYGEHFIIRFFSPIQTIGGGKVLFPYSKKCAGFKNRNKKLYFLQQLEHKWDSSDRIEFILYDLEKISVNELRLCSQMEKIHFEQKLSSLENKEKLIILRTGERICLSLEYAKKLWRKTEEALKIYHNKNPELPGALPEELTSYFPEFDLKTLREYIKSACRIGWGKKDGDRVALNSFESYDDYAFKVLAEQVLIMALSGGFQLTHINDLKIKFEIYETDLSRIINYYKNKKIWCIIGDGYLLPAETQKNFHKVLSSFEGDITVASLRDATETSRKYVLSLLEYFDSQGITRRVGDKRILLKKY